MARRSKWEYNPESWKYAGRQQSGCMLSMLLLVSAVLGLTFVSCSKEDAVGKNPREVNVILDYTFRESGNMSRATHTEVYDQFYESYIKTKLLTPKLYSLTFKNKATEKNVLTISGHWGEKTAVRLPEGEYTIIGQSRPVEKETYYGYEYPSDTVYLTFNETVKIEEGMTNLALTAIYDSFLLLFDTDNTSKISMSGPGSNKNLTKDNNIYWLFVRDISYRLSSGSSTGTYSLSLTRNNGDLIDIPLVGLSFEKGKYYYFNDLLNSFDVPKMESGK